MTLPYNIRNLQDVIQFFTHLILEDELNWHPDNEFAGYEYADGTLVFTDEEANRRTRLMAEAWDVVDALGLDIYCVGIVTDVMARPDFFPPLDGCEDEQKEIKRRSQKGWSPGIGGWEE